MFERVDDRDVVKAGKLNQLIIRLTSPLETAADAVAGALYR